MPAHRKPTALLKLVGADKKTPKYRAREDNEIENEVADLTQPPSEHFLTVWEKKWWKHTVERLPPDMIQKQDIQYLVQYVRIVAWLEYQARITQDATFEYSSQYDKALTQFRQMTGQLGLTPADRSKVFFQKYEDDKKHTLAEKERQRKEKAAEKLRKKMDT